MKSRKAKSLRPQNHLSENLPVTHKEMWKRATELAIANGRSSRNVAQTDWDDAKKELLAEPLSDSENISEPQSHAPSIDAGKDD